MSQGDAEQAAEPVVHGLFRVEGTGAVLLGGHSPSSGLDHFPLQPVCPYTGADDVVAVDLPRTGSLWYATEVTAAPPGYAGRVPYGLGVVELDGGLRVVGRILGDTPATIAPGTPMEVTTELVATPEGEDRTVWAFGERRPR